MSERLKMKDSKYRVVVEYPSEWYFTKDDYDDVIERAAKLEIWGTGMAFGVRDVDFGLKTKRGALNTFARLSKLRGVKVTVYDPKETIIKKKGK